MKRLTRIGMYIVVGSIAAALVLSLFASKTDMSVAGLLTVAFVFPAFLLGAAMMGIGIVGQLPRTARVIVIVLAVAGGVVAAASWAGIVIGPSRPHVSALTLEANQAEYKGPCPMTVKLSANITVDKGSGLVEYRFLGYSPSESSGQIEFEGPGTKTVTGALKFGQSGYAVAGPGDLRVRIEQGDRREATTDFTYECTNK